MIALNIWGCWHANRGTHAKEREEFSSCLGPAQTQKCARGRGAFEKVPDWVELNHFSTWLREQEFWQETESERTQRPGGNEVCVCGVMGWGEDGIPGKPRGNPDGNERAAAAGLEKQ